MAWDYPNPYTQPAVPQAVDIDGLQHTNNAVYVQWCERIGWAHSEALGLSRVIGVIVDVQDQEWGNPFVLGHMSHRREVFVLFGIVAELFAVSEFGLWLAVDGTTSLGRGDDRGDIVSIAIHGDAALDDRQTQSLGLEVSVIGTDQCRQLCSCGMTHDQHPLRITTIFGNMVVDPMN